MMRLISSTTISKSFNLIYKRTYAGTTSSSQFLKLNFALPHESIYDGNNVNQVNLPLKSGQIGVLANHVPIVEQLVPGVVEVIEGTVCKKFFVSGGFAIVQPNSSLSITSVEAFPIESFSHESVKALLTEAQKNVSSGDKVVATEATIQIEVLEALNAALK